MKKLLFLVVICIILIASDLSVQGGPASASSDTPCISNGDGCWVGHWIPCMKEKTHASAMY